ncbi:hypothetical protein [Ensifer sp. LCM 4579]|uniref:hypothetical protein n=1 Tax=Ensifer sp. LCM 4579 TaxID=1848292 RepID=UPI0008D9A041|nr:hypothetical protein [Ensifer sp. LCM 4579]OHV72772.1 hypothetical protein LCM4579_11795 [Ensifer sp. LCM 4579]
MFRDMPVYKKLIALGAVVVALVGVFDALANLPVVSGCSFYGNCDLADASTPPTDLGNDPVAQ